ncbi:MAG: hypothetical protein IT447_14760 [Phycisphaerales bacterium]|jgi:hypothetical protein|nr:hypothetical protein [Phycisphaerales bacterium]
MKFGVHRVEITPSFAMLMGGYDSRLDHFDGVHDPLTFTAVYLNDGQREAWIGSADLCQFPDGPIYEEGIGWIAKSLNCRPEAIFLNASHTHGGPLIRHEPGVENRRSPLRYSAGNRELILRYFDELWRKIAAALSTARDQATPGTLHYTQTTTDFPINRRKMTGHNVTMAPDPDGPVDDRLRLFAIRDLGGKLRVLLPILACHPTSTSSQHLLTADFVGAWRAAVETSLNHAVTFSFLQACAGDVRPTYTADGDQWRIVRLDELSKMVAPLCDQTLAAINGPWRDCGPLKLAFGARPMELPCETTYSTRQSLEKLQNGTEWEIDYMRACLSRLNNGQGIDKHISFRLQALQLNEQHTLLGLNCEPLCGLGKAIETAFGPHNAVVLGYTGGCLCYVPNDEELPRGGYETESYLWCPTTGPFKRGINQRFIDGCRQLMQQLHS